MSSENTQQVRSNDELGVSSEGSHYSRRLYFVLSPLIQMLEIRELAWTERESIASAMIATLEHHKNMEAERIAHVQSANVNPACWT